MPRRPKVSAKYSRLEKLSKEKRREYAVNCYRKVKKDLDELEFSLHFVGDGWQERDDLREELRKVYQRLRSFGTLFGLKEP